MIQTELIYDTEDVDNFEKEINEFLSNKKDEEIISVNYIQSGKSSGGVYYPLCVIVYKTNEAVSYDDENENDES